MQGADGCNNVLVFQVYRAGKHEDAERAAILSDLGKFARPLLALLRGRFPVKLPGQGGRMVLQPISFRFCGVHGLMPGLINGVAACRSVCDVCA